MKNQFGNNLKEELRVKGLTQKAVAQLLGVTPSTVNQWITGKREPSYDILLQICKVLNSTPTLLLGFPQIKDEKIKDEMK